MPFDPSTASPVDVKPTGTFDPNSVVPSGDVAQSVAPKPVDEQARKEYKEKSDSYYGNLSGVVDKLEGDRKTAMQELIKVAPPEQKNEYIARAVNQWFITSQMPDTDSNWISSNWDNVKRSFMRERMGIGNGNEMQYVSDQTLYDAISNRLKQGKLDTQEPFKWHVPLEIFPIQDAEKAAHQSFWESTQQPFLEAKKVNVSHIPNINFGGGPLSNPYVAASIWNGAGVSTINTLATPFNLALAAGAGGLSMIEELGTAETATATQKIAGSIAAKTIWGMKKVFAGLMGYSTYESGKETIQRLNDPNASTADVIESGSAALTTGFLTLHEPLAKFFAKEGVQGEAIADKIKEKTPVEAAQILREEASKQKDPSAANAASEAANALDKVGKYQEGPDTWKDASQLEFSFDPDVKAAAENISDKPFADAAEQDQVEPPINEEKTLEEKDAEPLIPFPPSPFSETSLKQETAELERKALAGAGFSTNEVRSIAPKMLSAKQILLNNPEAGADLLKRLESDPNAAVDPNDSALLLTYKQFLLNKLNRLNEIKNDTSQTPEAIANAEELYKKVSDESVRLIDAIKSRGSDAGLALRWQQVLIKENYDFATQSTLLRSAKGNVPLTPEEETDVLDKTNKVGEAQKKFDEHIDKTKPKSKDEKVDEVIKDAKEKPIAFKYAERVQSILKSKAAESRKILTSGKVLSVGPDTLYHLGVIGAEHIYSTGLDFAKWSDEMIKDLGEKVKPYLKEAFEAAKKQFGESYRSNAKEGLLDAIRDKDTDEVASLAQGIARSYIIEGVDKRDELVDKVHKEFTDAGSDYTKREVRDAISGYGKYKNLTLNEVDNILRDLKGQLLQVSKLEDLERTGDFKKTGFERRTPSEEEKDLSEQVKSTQESLAEKDRISKEIDDLRQKIAGTYPVSKATGKPLTRPQVEAIEKLAQERDSLKEKLKVKAAKESEVKRLDKQIEDKLAELSGQPKIVEGKLISRPQVPEIEKRLQRLAELNKQLAEQRKERPVPQETLLRRVQARVQSDIDKLQKAINERKPITGTKNKVAYDSETERLIAERDRLKEEYKKAFDDPTKTAEQKLNRWKAITKAKIDKLEDKVRRGDIAPEPKRDPMALDKEGIKLKTDLERAKQDLEILREKAKQARKSKVVKAAETIQGIARMFAISGYDTLAKLASFTGGAIVDTPLAEFAGAVIRKVPGFGNVFKKASMESGVEFKALADFYAKGATEGAREAWNTLTKGKSDLKTELGDRMRNIKERHWYDFVGLIHEAEKSPLLTADYYLRLRKAYDYALKNGYDVTDPMVAAAIRKEAFDYATQSILQQNNNYANAVNKIFGDTEARNPDLDDPSITKLALSTFVRTFFTKGIVKTPLNYIRGAIDRSPIGLTRGIAKNMRYMKGVDNLSNKEANIIARLLKIGSVGTALFIWGAIDATKPPDQRMFGGYYQPGQKRDSKDVSFGKLRIAGHELPHWASHTLLTESGQMGSTFMRVALSKLPKEEATTAYIEGVIATLWGLAGHAPVTGKIGDIAVDASRNQYNKIVTDSITGLVPELAQNIARDIDKKNDKPVSRKPTTIKEAVEVGIPGLRQQVPETKPKRDVGKRFKTGI